MKTTVGYLGWTQDAATLASAVSASRKLQRRQLVLCPPDCGPAVRAAGADAAEDLAELAGSCGAFLLTEGSDVSLLPALARLAAPRAVLIDLSPALPEEKLRRAGLWEEQGGLYADAAAPGSLAEAAAGGTVFFSGNGAVPAARWYLQRLFFAVYVDGAAGSAAALRLLRTCKSDVLSELLPELARFHALCPAPDRTDLTADRPENEGVANALRRARRMVDVRWQSVRPLPKVLDLTATGYFSPDVPVTGLPYSSARMEEKYIGPNVSFETFFSAVHDPNSVLYTRDLCGDGNAAAYYGTVCSVFVGQALDLPVRVPTKLWPEIPGMRLICPCRPEELKLGDTLLSATHVVMVTGIDRDRDGRVAQVSVSEATHPRCLCRTYRTDVFEEYFFRLAGFRVYRYDGIDRVTDGPEQDPARWAAAPERAPELTLDFGDGANCALGAELTLTARLPGRAAVCAVREGGETLRFDLHGEPGAVRFRPEHCGAWSAYCVSDDGAASPPVRFSVFSCRIELDCGRCQPERPVRVRLTDEGGGRPECVFLVFDGAEGDHVRETRAIRWLTPEEQRAGVCLLTYGEPGRYLLKGFFRNTHGLYSSGYASLEIAQD